MSISVNARLKLCMFNNHARKSQEHVKSGEQLYVIIRQIGSSNPTIVALPSRNLFSCGDRTQKRSRYSAKEL